MGTAIIGTARRRAARDLVAQDLAARDLAARSSRGADSKAHRKLSADLDIGLGIELGMEPLGRH
jgi:hypothetical protein